MTDIEVTDDDRVDCPQCGKSVTVNPSGALRKHQCVSADGTVTEVKGKAPKATRATKRQAPAKVRQLGVAVLGTGIEWGAEKFVMSVTDEPVPVIGTDDTGEARKLTDLPDADVMIAPFINLLWPQLPPAVQRTIASMAEHEDVIAAMFAWLEWGQQIKRYTDALTEEKAKERERLADESNDALYPEATGFDNATDGDDSIARTVATLFGN